jgi:hypothetical protein
MAAWFRNPDARGHLIGRFNGTRVQICCYSEFVSPQLDLNSVGRKKNFGCFPKIVLAVKIALSRQLLPPTLRHPFSKVPSAQGFDRDQHNLWDTTKNFEKFRFSFDKFSG